MKRTLRDIIAITAIGALSEACNPHEVNVSPQTGPVAETQEEYARKLCNVLGEGSHVLKDSSQIYCGNPSGIYWQRPGQAELRFDFPETRKISRKELLDYTRGKRVVLFGEDHGVKEEDEKLLEILPQLKTEGFTHLGVEMDESLQKYVDHYFETGDETSIAEVMGKFVGGKQNMKIIRAARAAGMKVVMIDHRPPFKYTDLEWDTLDDDMKRAYKKAVSEHWNLREKLMFENIRKILQDPGTRLITFNGRGHVTSASVSYFVNGGGMNLVKLQKPIGFRLAEAYGKDKVGLVDLMCDDETSGYTFTCVE